MADKLQRLLPAKGNRRGVPLALVMLGGTSPTAGDRSNICVL